MKMHTYSHRRFDLLSVCARCLLLLLIVLLIPSAGFAETEVTVEKEKALIDWGQNYIEGSGMAVAPTNTVGAQAKALARRGAMVDLQRNMLEFVCGVQIDSRTTMDDFMAEDRVRSEVHGLIRNIEILKGEWDGESYTVTGRIKTEQLRLIVNYVVTLVQ